MRSLLLLLVLLFPAVSARAAARAPAALHWIVWTNPSTNALGYWAIDPTTGDSTFSYDCGRGGGAPLHDLAKVRVWRWPITGGMPQLLLELSEVGREGRPDSTQVTEGAHYFVTAVDTTGRNNTCQSNTIYIGAVTAVVTPPMPDWIVETKVFDVAGRLVREPRASGVYFYAARWHSGRITTGKLPPILR